MLSQFSALEGKQTLKDYFDLPIDIYPVGRLDYDSEGLLVLTNDKALNHQLLNPSFAHEREYWVQVDGDPEMDTLKLLEPGVIISVDGKWYKTRPCEVEKWKNPPAVPDRHPPIRYRKNIPATWVKIRLKEGKNRQVRKMFAKIGFPVLRLIRYRIEHISIENLHPGEIKELDKKEIYRSLGLTYGR